MKAKQAYLTFPYMLWAVAFIIIPLVMVFYYGLTSRSTGAFTLENILAISRPEHLKALWFALILSLISTVICILMAYPLSLILASFSQTPNALILLIFILPMWMNYLLRTIAWQELLEKNGVINTMLSFFSLPALSIINTPVAVVLGMVYNSLPFMILPIYNSLIKIDKEVINSAYDLGANWLTAFTKVILPLSLPGVISGITFVFIPSLTTFVISNLLGGGKLLLIGNVIEMEFMVTGNWHLGSGLSVVLLTFTVISMVLSAMFDKDQKGAFFS